MKKLPFVLSAILLLSLLTGCAGTPVVYYSDCTCPTGSHQTVPAPVVPAEGAVKTGLYVSATISDSTSATAEKNGAIKYDVLVIAVTVDDNGVIADCIIDSIPATVSFDQAGAITSDISSQVLSKNELGESYGMKLYGGAKYEWNEQAEALANYAVGKTVEQLRSGAVSETGHAVDADLASTATIYLGGYVAGIEAAVAGAQHLGAQAGEELRLAAISSLTNSTGATTDKNGTAQLDVDITALTMHDGIITSCVIDSLQAKASFGADGVITTDLSALLQTKNQLGENYNMKLYGGAKYEWNEQAAAFAAYVTGKTPAEVAGIAVTEGKPADADLSASVTIAIGGFQALLQKAAA